MELSIPTARANKFPNLKKCGYVEKGEQFMRHSLPSGPACSTAAALVFAARGPACSTAAALALAALGHRNAMQRNVRINLLVLRQTYGKLSLLALELIQA